MTVSFTYDLMKTKLCSKYTKTTLADALKAMKDDANTPNKTQFFGNQQRVWYKARLDALSVSYGATDHSADLAHLYWSNASAANW